MHHLVPKAGLEPARISTVDFESTASTDFATSALKGMRKRSGLYLSAAVMQATACHHCAKCRKKQRYPAQRHLLLPFHSATATSNPPLTLPQIQLHLPATPLSPCSPQTPLKVISNFSHLTLTCIPITIHLSPKNPPRQSPTFPQPHHPPFPYIPESFSQYLFVIHSLRSQILISSIFL